MDILSPRFDMGGPRLSPFHFTPANDSFVSDLLSANRPWSALGMSFRGTMGTPGIQDRNNGMARDQAITALAKHFDVAAGSDGLYNMDDLRNIVNGVFTHDVKNTNYPPELRAAAKYFVDNPAEFTKVETADGVNARHGGATPDGIASKKDLVASLVDAKMPVEHLEALDVLARNFDKVHLSADSTFGKPELERLSKDGSNPELAWAARTILRNPDLFMRLDSYWRMNGGTGGHTDNLIHSLDVSKLIANTSDFKAMNTQRAADAQFAVSRSQVYLDQAPGMPMGAGIDGPYSPYSPYAPYNPYMGGARMADPYMSNPAFMTAGHHAYPGIDHFGAALAQQPVSRRDSRAVQSLLRHADLLPDRLGRHELARIAHDPHMPRDLRHGAKRILQDENGLFRRLDTALRTTRGESFRGGDQRITKAELVAFANRSDFMAAAQYGFHGAAQRPYGFV